MVQVGTSLLNANENKILDIIHNLDNAKTDYFHIDVMDGEFVKNDTHDKMLTICEYITHVSRTPMDVHLMVKDVKNFVDSYAIFNPNTITFHYEACKDENEVMELIKYVKEKARKVGLAISPETEVEKIKKFLPYVHEVLVMTVVPGEGGQKLIPETINKIEELSKIRDDENLDFDIEVDGGINVENSDDLKENGADILVAGSAILNSKNYKKTIKDLKI